MAAAGDIYLSKYPGWYSSATKLFLTSPNLPRDRAQPSRTDRRACRVGRGGELLFRLSAYQDRLLKLYRDAPDFVTPEKYRNEIIASSNGVGRSVDQPFDLRLGHSGSRDTRHVMYVWVDALTNYLTGTGFPDPAAPRRNFGRQRACDRQGHHAISCDLLAGVPDVGRVALPRQIVVHGFLFNRGEKCRSRWQCDRSACARQTLWR